MREIPLTRGVVALVDDQDYERIVAHKWYCTAPGYAARTVVVGGVQRMVLMHREVLHFPAAPHIDHANGNRTDNTRANLRPCEVWQNSGNCNRRYNATSQYKGVTRRSGFTAWHAEIRVGGKSKHLGSFRTEEAAARAYDRAALKKYGSFARLNFPSEAA